MIFDMVDSLPEELGVLLVRICALCRDGGRDGAESKFETTLNV